MNPQPDDSQPVTLEWLDTLPHETMRDGGSRLQMPLGRLEWQFYDGRRGLTVWLNGYILPHALTRGQTRLICTALGLEQK